MADSLLLSYYSTSPPYYYGQLSQTDGIILTQIAG